MNDAEDWGTVWEHLAALRQTLLSSVFIIFIGFICAFCFSESIIQQLVLPLTSPLSLKNQLVEHRRITNETPNPRIFKIPSNSKAISFSSGVKRLDILTYHLLPNETLEIETIKEEKTLVMLSPLEGILVSFKVAFWISFGLTSPIWGFYLLRFILPALHRHERRLLIPFCIASLVCLSLGLLFAYFATIPLANQYLTQFNSSLGSNLWSLSHYVDYTLVLLMANAIAFELGAILLFSVELGLIHAESMRAKRRHVILGAFIIAAILTPPDVLTQFLLAIPLICFYELAILYASISYRHRRGRGDPVHQDTAAIRVQYR